ncbi:hypothetical protein HUJ04_010805 [Dendroctonus ponderosae]|nr:hypothetical protein HUJ04_010805 [Dendroctonus ponderosae]
MKNILMSVIKTVYRMKCHGLVLVFPLILCKVVSYDLTTKRCQLKNKQIGRCIPKSICAIDAKINTNADPESPGCSSGSICCQMFAKIVTPDNGNSGSVSNGISDTSTTDIGIEATIKHETIMLCLGRQLFNFRCSTAFRLHTAFLAPKLATALHISFFNPRVINRLCSIFGEILSSRMSNPEYKGNDLVDILIEESKGKNPLLMYPSYGLLQAISSEFVFIFALRANALKCAYLSNAYKFPKRTMPSTVESECSGTTKNCLGVGGHGSEIAHVDPNVYSYCYNYTLPEIPFDTDPEFPLSSVTIFANIWQQILPELHPGDSGLLQHICIGIIVDNHGYKLFQKNCALQRLTHQYKELFS